MNRTINVVRNYRGQFYIKMKNESLITVDGSKMSLESDHWMCGKYCYPYQVLKEETGGRFV